MSAITDLLDGILVDVTQLRALLAITPPSGPLLHYPLARLDRTITPKPPLHVGAKAGTTWLDPAFGTRHLRVTDPSMGGASWRVSSNAHQAAWNAASDHFYVTGPGGVKIFAFDDAAFTATDTGLMPYTQSEPTWSRHDPDALFTIGGPISRTIQRWSLKANTFTDVVDLDTIVPGLAEPRTYVGSLASSGTPETLSILFGGAMQDDHHLVLNFELPAGPYQLLDSLDRPAPGCRLHNMARDMSGRFVLLYARTPDIPAVGQVVVWDVINDTLTRVIKAPFGHDAIGFGIWINMDTSGGRAYDAREWQRRDLTMLAGDIDLVLNEPTPQEVYLADHTNWNNAQPGVLLPVISATYRTLGLPVVPWGVWDDEILAIDTAGTGDVYRFGHHRSNVIDEVQPDRLNFWAEPIINVAPDGNKAIYTSNQERTLGPEPNAPGYFRQDVFLVKLR